MTIDAEIDTITNGIHDVYSEHPNESELKFRDAPVKQSLIKEGVNDMGFLKNSLHTALVNAPEGVWHCAETILKEKTSPDTVELYSMERYARYLLKHFDKAWEQVTRNRKAMVIETGEFGYTYLNVAYLNNMITLIFYSMYKGCVPVIRINQDKPQDNKWDWYFLQPSEVMHTDIAAFERIPCDVRNLDLRPTMQMVHAPKKNWKYQFFKLLFRKFVCLNEKTSAYIQNEIHTIGDPSRMLGVLMRGTDYVKLRPKGHPVQPEPEEIVSEAAKRFNKGAYTATYVATEEKRLFDMVASAVGSENVRENKRKYYDAIYHQSGEDLIGKVRFDRENDNYWKGLEYLSSMIILSKCRTLVAGNCGGTLFAMLMSDNYTDPHIFNYGIY